MSISRDRFDELQQLWGDHASWAVWQLNSPEERPKAHVGDRTVLDPAANPDLLDVLTSEVIMIGLNASSRSGGGQAWANFHDASPDANDFKLRFAAQGTSFWGAYMTDALVDFPETDSALVASYIKSNPVKVTSQLDRLDEEILSVGATDPVLVALGGLAFDLVRHRFEAKYRVVKVTHYAHFVSKEALREEMVTVIEGARRSPRPK